MPVDGSPITDFALTSSGVHTHITFASRTIGANIFRPAGTTFSLMFVIIRTLMAMHMTPAFIKMELMAVDFAADVLCLWQHVRNLSAFPGFE